MNLIKAKLNVNVNDSKFSKNNYYQPHIDFPYKGITAIYYVNDCDGDTFFFKKEENKLKIIKQISPKKGSLIYFDNTIFHAGQPPFNSNLRAILNLNFTYQQV